MYVNGKLSTLHHGDMAYMPRMTPHAFANLSDQPVRFLGPFTPSGFEKFFALAAEAGKAHMPGTPEYAAEMQKVHQQVDYEPLGPPPFGKPGPSACGVSTKRGRHCLKCGKEVSGEKLIELAKKGRIVTLGADAQRKRSETQKRHEAAKWEWRNSSKAGSVSNEIYDTEIQPRLTSITIAEIASTLGVSEPYAAGIRSGRRRPHPRHWQILANLAGISERT